MTTPAEPATGPLPSALADLRRGTLAAAAVGLFVSLLQLAGPLFIIQVYDRVIPAQSLETLIALALLAAVALVFQGCLDFLRHRVLMVLGERFTLRMGAPTFEAAVSAALRKPGQDTTGVLRDLNELRTFVANGTVALPVDLVAAPLFLAVLFLMHPIYGLVGVVAAALLTGVAALVEVSCRRPMTAGSRGVQRLQAETAAAIRRAEPVHAMGMLPNLVGRWHADQARALSALVAAQTDARALTVLAKSLRSGLQFAIIATGALLVMEQQVSPGTIIAASIIMGRALMPFEQLIEGWRQWSDALGSLQRLREVLAGAGAPRTTPPIPIDTGRLVVDRLWFVPDGRQRAVLRNVSFELEPGELLGVIGPSGAGKSSLARLLVGVTAPTNGAVYLDGHNVFTHDRGAFGRAVGYVPQEPSLLRGTVAINISRMAKPDMRRVIAAARIAGVHELIGALPRGYETEIGESDCALSGGQRQRVALARALYGDPHLLVLDEPNASLDAEGEAALVAAVDAARSAGATVVIVAQRMSILNRASKLLLLQEGTVAAYGSRDDVLHHLRQREGMPADKRIATLPLRRVEAQ